MTDARVVLRYFPVRGRAQALRHSLQDAGVDFEDVRVPVADWPRCREDRALSGPYRALPTLRWAGIVLAETLPIAGFIARKLGQYDGIGDDGIARREGICSTCYFDVLQRLVEVIRADQSYPGADCGLTFSVAAPRILQKLSFVEEQVPAGSWIGGAAPVVADFFAVEAFDVLRYVLGPAKSAALAERFPRLTALARAVEERPRLAGAFENRPARFTGRSDEDRVLEQLRVVDLSSLGI
jgi:glutathione S-transferase